MFKNIFNYQNENIVETMITEGLRKEMGNTKINHMEIQEFGSMMFAMKNLWNQSKYMLRYSKKETVCVESEEKLPTWKHDLKRKKNTKYLQWSVTQNPVVYVSNWNSKKTERENRAKSIRSYNSWNRSRFWWKRKTAKSSVSTRQDDTSDTMSR